MNSVYAANEPTRVDVDAMRESTVIEFGAPWCPICQGAQPLIEQAFANRQDVQHIKVEDGKGQPLGRSFRVKLWPTLIFMREGRELARVVRPTTVQQIEQGFASIA
jgi:thioredoxin 1